MKRFVHEQHDLQHHITRFFERIDPWMPVIPRRHLMHLRQDLLAATSPQLLLLLASLKVLVKQLPDDDAMTKDYLYIRAAVFRAQVSSSLDIATAQATLLILLYEFGHGIYPAAYLTLGAYCQYLLALRINSANLDQLDTQDWFLAEQRRRLWWAGIVLDR